MQPSAHVPGTVTAEVPIDGGRLILALTTPGDRLTLLVSTDRSLALLDAAAVDLLLVELADAAGRMAASESPGG